MEKTASAGRVNSSVPPAGITTAASITTSNKNFPLKAVKEESHEALETLQIHLGNLESRLEFYREENAVLKGGALSDAQTIAELNAQMERLGGVIEGMTGQARDYQHELHHRHTQHQLLRSQLLNLSASLQAERQENADLRNLKVADCTMRLCRQLEQADEREMEHVEASELRKRLAAMTIAAQNERREGERLAEQLRRTQIRLERAEKALSAVKVSDVIEVSNLNESLIQPIQQIQEIEQIQPIQQIQTINSHSKTPLLNPFAKKSTKPTPIFSKISNNSMVPANVLKTKPKSSGSVVNPFGGMGRVVRFSDGKGHFL